MTFALLTLFAAIFSATSWGFSLLLVTLVFTEIMRKKSHIWFALGSLWVTFVFWLLVYSAILEMIK